MYEFAILMFGGLATWLGTKLVSQYGKEMTRTSGYVLMAGLGVGYAYLVDYSLFEAWGIAVRSDTIGHVITGFMLAGVAHVWDHAFDYMHALAHGNGRGAKRLSRAA